MDDVTYYSKATDEEKVAFRKWMRSMLHLGPVTIWFKKSDGTEREMNCTLQDGVAIPHEKKTDKVKVINEEVCPVWDIDKGAWRSFKFESITKVNIDI